MNILARILEVTLDALLEAGIPLDPDAHEWQAEAEIEIALRPQRDMSDIAVVRMCWLDQFWYVFLWRWWHEDWESYSIDEVCRMCEHTSTLPLQMRDGQRICVTCAKCSNEQVEQVYQDMLAGKR